jgi:hypothetical protein
MPRFPARGGTFTSQGLVRGNDEVAILLPGSSSGIWFTKSGGAPVRFFFGDEPEDHISAGTGGHSSQVRERSTKERFRTFAARGGMRIGTNSD